MMTERAMGVTRACGLAAAGPAEARAALRALRTAAGIVAEELAPS